MENTTLADFYPEVMERRNAGKRERKRIRMHLAGFSAKKLRNGLLQRGGHPKPEWGGGESWRYFYLKECSRRGKRLLKELEWPTDEKAFYVNRHTGTVERLSEVLNFWAFVHRDQDQANRFEHVDSVVEHWEPHDSSRPNRFLIRHLESRIRRLNTMKASLGKDAEKCAEIRMIPSFRRLLMEERSRFSGEDAA